MQLKGELNEKNQLWLAGNAVATKYVCVRRYEGEGTTSDIKITRDEAISAHELNKICAFLLLTTFKVATLFFSTEISADQRLQQKTCQFLPSSIRAANPMS